ncbi:MAG: histidine kinase [Ginsengibacter sp.]
MVISFPPKGGGSVNGIGVMGFSRYYEMVFIRTLFHIFCQGLFCYLLMYLLIPVFFWKKKYLQFMGFLILLWFVVGIFRFIIFNYGYNPLMYQLKFDLDPSSLILVRSFTQTLGGPAFASFIFISLKFFKDWQQKQKDNFNLQRENAFAELNLLKAQVHPHFLFNTLNNIYAFALNKSDKAGKMVLQLSDMMKYMINDCATKFVPLNKELKMMDDYMGLEKVRYGNRLNIKIDIEGAIDDKIISPLFMIPFVENSFKHGASKILKDPWIKLFIQADETVLHFTLSNSKAADVIRNNKSGIGLRNVKKRLELLYPQNHLLLIEETANTFTVNMQVPIFSDTEIIAKYIADNEYQKN